MGSGKDCLKKPSQYCNGPLDSGSQYRLEVYVDKISSVIRGVGRDITIPCSTKMFGRFFRISSK